MVVGLGTVPLGLGTVPLGLGTAPLGLGTTLLGLGKALPGLGTALLGLGTVLLGLGRHATRIRAQFLTIRVWVRLCSIFIFVTFENKKSIASKHLWYMVERGHSKPGCPCSNLACVNVFFFVSYTFLVSQFFPSFF